MAKRRNFRAANFDFDGVNRMLQIMLQNDLVGKRQQSMADYEHGLSMERLKTQQNIDTAQKLVPNLQAGKMMPGAVPPELAESLGGPEVVEAMIPSQETMEAPGREQIRSAKTQGEIPDIQTLIAERAARGPITELGPLTGTLRSRTSRLDQIGEDQSFQDDRVLAMEQGKAYESGVGTERATAEAHPAVMGREKAELEQKTGIENKARLDLERGLSPILVNRAADQTTANLRATSDFQMQDPALKALARQVLTNPETLDKLNAADRGKVLRVIAMDPDPSVVTLKQQSSKGIIEAAANALKNVRNHPGLPGAVGMKGPSSAFGLFNNPISGTDARDFVNYFDQLKSSLTLSRLDILRGLGHMSDTEFATAGKSATSLDRSMQEGTFAGELDTVDQALRRAWERAGLSPQDFPDSGASMVPQVTPQLESGRSKLEIMRNGR